MQTFSRPEFDRYSISTVPVTSVLPGDSPRLVGVSDEHVRILVESMADLPPILVHRATMRVIDGMHRLRAAILRGQSEIDVRFYDGDEVDAFVIAVQENIAHGLPLSLLDRTEAAARVVASHPHWSDRVIAKVTGVAPNTVGATRRRSTEQNAHSNTRVGQDGRVRPVTSEAGRKLAGELLTENPHASLREVAKVAAIAPSTVRDVRERLRNGQDPVPSKQRPAIARSARPSESSRRAKLSSTDRGSALRNLTRDPSLRLNVVTRTLLRWLSIPAEGRSEWDEITSHLPSYCVDIVAGLARQNASAWHKFADDLEQLGHSGDGKGGSPAES